ncbi:MAG TPA: hypothetical protein VFY39_14980 [Gammaproteobacteria bacterium]|nr:hypothetical protein [Gammaproteobacteria bacterium]
MDFDETITEADLPRRPPDSGDESVVSAGLEASRPAGEDGSSAPFELEMDAWEPSLLRKLLGQ